MPQSSVCRISVLLYNFRFEIIFLEIPIIPWGSNFTTRATDKSNGSIHMYPGRQRRSLKMHCLYFSYNFYKKKKQKQSTYSQSQELNFFLFFGTLGAEKHSRLMCAGKEVTVNKGWLFQPKTITPQLYPSQDSIHGLLCFNLLFKPTYNS